MAGWGQPYGYDAADADEEEVDNDR